MARDVARCAAPTHEDRGPHFSRTPMIPPTSPSGRRFCDPPRQTRGPFVACSQEVRRLRRTRYFFFGGLGMMLGALDNRTREERT